MKKLVLFDLDGTLVNAGGAGRTSLRKAIKELYGVEPEFDHSLISGRTDLDNFSIVYSLIKKGKKPTAAEMKKMKAKYLEILPTEVHAVVRCKKYDLIPGVEKFLKMLAKDKDVILGLGTGNLEEGAKIKLEPSKLASYFTVGGYGEDGQTREEMLQAAVKRAEKKFKTKLEPDQVYVIGDTHRDICAAKNCGFHSAVLTNGFGDAQKIQRAAAELETKDFNDLTTFCVWLGLKTDPKGVKRGSYIMPASAIEHVFFSRTGIDEDRLKMLRIKKYSDLESGTIM
ncbi:HAD hydrolase-like protein [Candidatus Avelusimicrobium fimicolum]|uniref:HAD family hydrolase n=1 Tax=Candidatus Avelusimicrobium fimicolum TaxID=3416216 RepID=UPI0015AC939A|nr:HAD family hydrolase [Spirochaetia bacterium]